MWFLGVVAAMILAVVLLRHYAERTTQLYILCLVAFSWSLGFIYFLVLPFDLEHAFCRACREHGSHAGDCRCLPMPGIELLVGKVADSFECFLDLAHNTGSLEMTCVLTGSLWWA